MEKTLVILKPDALERGLVGSIINRFEFANIKISKMDLRTAEIATLKKHYPDEIAIRIGKKNQESGIYQGDNPTQYGLDVLTWTRNYMMRGPVVVMVLEGLDVIKRVRRIIGSTDPLTAPSGTIRGDFGADSLEDANRNNRAAENLIHASGNPEEATNEIKFWF